MIISSAESRPSCMIDWTPSFRTKVIEWTAKNGIQLSRRKAFLIYPDVLDG